MHFILASQSPARLKTLQNAGLDPEVIVADVDESAVLYQYADQPFSEQVKMLALAKAEAVANTIADKITGAAEPQHDAPPTLILACDSMYEFEGQLQGKPHTPEVAFERIKAQQGKSGILHTGHCLLKLEGNESTVALHTVSTTVHFDMMTDDEIRAYIATGEPLEVAGSFTIDSIGSAFIREIEGDYHSVVGVSPRCLRKLCGEVGVEYLDLKALN